MMILQDRILHLKGSPYEVGYQAGRAMRRNLADTIHTYLQKGPLQFSHLNLQDLERGAMDWFAQLPVRFQQEMEGLAEGSGIPLQRLAEWSYADDCPVEACSAFLVRFQDEVWVGRNNDMWVPELWGYATIREVAGRISTINFGIQGELWVATGINRNSLWLHYNYLPAWDTPDPAVRALAPYVWMSDALETCSTLAEVEHRLQTIQRSGGMMVFAIEGESNQAANFECGCKDYIRREMKGNWLAGTNHALALATPQEAAVYATNSLQRYERIAELLSNLTITPADPQALRAILADDQIEQRDPDYGTVYAALACPARQYLAYTFGGYPAASQGNWQYLPWPW